MDDLQILPFKAMDYLLVKKNLSRFWASHLILLDKTGAFSDF